MTNNYEKNYLIMKSRLADCDLAESAGRLGLKLLSNGAVEADYLKKKFIISHESIEPADGQQADANDRVLLNHYILSSGGGDLEGTFLLLRNLSGMPSSKNDERWDMASEPLAKAFDQVYDRFAAAMRRLGGVYEGPAESGGHTWRLNVLPKIAMRLVYHEGDDEFPTDIQIFFDKGYLKFVDFECLTVVGSSVVDELIAIDGNRDS